MGLVRGVGAEGQEELRAHGGKTVVCQGIHYPDQSDQSATARVHSAILEKWRGKIKWAIWPEERDFGFTEGLGETVFWAFLRQSLCIGQGGRLDGLLDACVSWGRWGFLCD